MSKEKIEQELKELMSSEHIQPVKATLAENVSPDGIGYEDVEGGYSPDAQSLIQAGILGCCCCGTPEDNILYVYKGLTYIEGVLAFTQDTHKMVSAQNNKIALELFGTEQARKFFLYWSNQVGLSEHGTTINGSWLTDDGEKFIKLAEEYLTTEFIETTKKDTEQRVESGYVGAVKRQCDIRSVEGKTQYVYHIISAPSTSQPTLWDLEHLYEEYLTDDPFVARNSITISFEDDRHTTSSSGRNHKTGESEKWESVLQQKPGTYQIVAILECIRSEALPTHDRYSTDEFIDCFGQG